MSSAATHGALPGAATSRAGLVTMRGAAAAVLATALFAIFHPYLGILGDASIYLGRSLADLDPAGVGRDIAFVDDGQSRFSIFSRLVDPLVAVEGATRASILIAAAGSACLLAASLALARALTRDSRLVFAIVVAAAVLPTIYGDGIFHFSEAAAVPRPFAEAAVTLAIAALLAGRPLAAGLLLAVALLIHPIMAMAGIGTVLVLLAWRRSARAAAVAVAAMVAVAAVAAIAGWLGLPLFDRLVLRVDPEWLAMLSERSPYLFPSHWHAAAFSAPIAQAATVVLAARRGGRARRRVLAAVAISAFLQLAAAAVFGDGLHLLLAIQVQGWRALWLLGLVGACCLPLVAAEMWLEGAQARVALALLGLAWLGDLGPVATPVACAAALALGATPLPLPLRDRHAVWALAAAALIVGLGTVETAIGWAAFVAGAPRGADIGLLAALRCDLLVAPLCLALAIWLLAPVRAERSFAGAASLAVLALAAATGAAACWDERGPAQAFFSRQDGFAPAAVPGDRSSEVLVIGGLSEAWFALDRPQYFSPQQAVGIVFSRPLAVEWRRRGAALRALGLVPHNVARPWEALTPDDLVVVTPAKLATFCGRDDAPAAVVVPDRDDAPAPSIPGAVTWKAASPRPFVENVSPPRWHTIRGWVVAPCAARQRPALAKTGAR